MAEERLVHIQDWPAEPAGVNLKFEESPANVTLQTKDPIGMDMRMAMTVRQDVPLCIKICEPICARSEYTIRLDIFGNPVAAITIRGLTTFFACDDKAPSPR